MSDPFGSAQTLERELLEFAPDAVVGVDEDGLIVLANSRTQEVFGYSRDELIGRSVEQLVPDHLRGGHAGHRQGYFEAPRTRPMGAGLDLYARRKDGSEFPCEISLSAVETGSGLLALAAVRDITERRRSQDELTRTVRRLQAAADVALAVGGETDIGRVLDAIVGRGRALVDARALVILLREGRGLKVAATAGALDPRVRELEFEPGEASEEILRGTIGAARQLGSSAANSLVAPLVFRGEPFGVAVALDRAGEPRRFDIEDQRLLEAFAASAATALATARSAAEERVQNTIEAAEQERSRWARELHDETLQALAVLRMTLSSALRQETSEALEEAGREAVAQISDEITNLRSLITELRPAALDQIGLEAALHALAEHHGRARDLEVSSRVELPRDQERPPVLETTVYRLVQEALSNVARHSHAAHAELAVTMDGGRIEVMVSDDGIGFEPALVKEGFGLAGMRERTGLIGGSLEISSTHGAGTVVRARIPTHPAPAAEELDD
ncbi:MAG: PAS domain S-box protein [Solirubrobacterales bacterium]